jgi:hypothetical protein
MGRILGATPGTYLTNEFTVDSGTGASNVPAVAVRSDGKFLVAWQMPACGSASLMLRYFNSNGTPITAALDQGAAWAGPPQVAALSNGEFIVTWNRLVGDDVRVYATKYTPPS